MNILERNKHPNKDPIRARIEGGKILAGDIKHAGRLTPAEIQGITTTLAYAWIKTGQWKKKDFEKWLSVRLNKSTSSAKAISEAQLQELATIFGLKKVEETLPVRDGVVTRESMVWWRCEGGLERVVAKQDWSNIKAYPQAYQLAKPRTRVEYLEDEC